MDIISANSLTSKKVAMSAENSPATSVAYTGVLKRGLTTPKNLKIKPSLAMAYNTRGNGNMAPSNEVDRPARAPTVITFWANV